VDGRARHIVENTDFVDTKPVLWVRKTAQALDAAAAHASRLVSQMFFECGTHSASNIRF